MSPRILSLFQTSSGEDALTSGGVTFDVFVRTLNFFHAATPVEVKLKNLFRVYDIDGDGVVSESDLDQMMKYYVGPHLSDAARRVIVRKTMQHALTRCAGGVCTVRTNADGEEARGLNFDDFSRVLGADGMDALNVHIPIQS